MKRLLSALLCLLTLTGSAQDTEFFIPVHQNALRLPAVPLITVDPYFCLWSKYDHLYDGSVTHWSGVKKPLNGAAYVDGTAYRFMGESLESIYPVAAEKAWTGKYVTSKPSGAWSDIDYDDSSWKDLRSTAVATFARATGRCGSSEYSECSDAIYDLCGRKMVNGKLPRGIYIKDGKKTLIK